MVEVFKTNVTNHIAAKQLVTQLHENFLGCKANFDLDDCDLILRIQFASGTALVNEVIELLDRHGFIASVLPDEITQESF